MCCSPGDRYFGEPGSRSQAHAISGVHTRSAVCKPVLDRRRDFRDFASSARSWARARGSLTRSSRLHSLTLCRRAGRIVALGDLFQNVSVGFVLNPTRGVAPPIKWFRKIRVVLDATPKRGLIKRLIIAEFDAHLRGGQNAWTCLETGHNASPTNVRR
jgi:hypothetical protein